MTKINDLSVINTLTDTNKLIVWDGATRAITAKNLADYVGQAFGPFQPLDGGLTAIAGLQFGIGDFMESTGVDTFRIRKLVVQTYADLQNIAPEGRFDGLVVYTVNRETAGDGGEGWWRFSASSTDAANGGTILEPNLGSGRWFRQSPSESGEVNVLSFGAKGDGVTDDTAAFTAALAAAGVGTVFVPAGSYVITGTITGDFWSTGGTTIIGGTVNTIITPQDISADAAAAIAAKIAAETAETNAETAEAGAVAARVAAESARDAAQLSKGIFESTAAALGNGVQGHGAITGGSGGTDGTFPLITSGGTQVVPVRGTFVVSGGAVTEINVYYPGYYSSNPTGFDFSASSGLTSASATPTMGVNAGIGEYFSVPSTTPDELILYRVTAGPAATEVLRYPSVETIDAFTSGEEGAPSYSNAGGQGDRTASITAFVSPSLLAAGTASNLVDGATGNNNTDSIAFNAVAVSGLVVSFDFGESTRRIITEATWKQSGSQSHGSWKWQGSNDNSAWSDIGSSFTLGGATTQTQTQLAGNRKGFRYYRLLGVSGTASGGPYIQEVEFKIAKAVTDNYVTLPQLRSDTIDPLAKLRLPANVVSYYPCDEGTGNLLRDIIGRKDADISNGGGTVTWTRQGWLQLTSGWFKTPAQLTQTVVLLFRAPEGHTGYYWAMPNLDGVGQAYYGASTATIRSLHGWGVSDVPRRTSAAGPSDIFSGGWCMVSLQIASATNNVTAIGSGNFIGSGAISSMEVAGIAILSGTATDAQLRQIANYAGEQNRRRGIYLTPFDCPRYAHLAAVVGESTSEGTFPLASLSADQRAAQNENVLIDARNNASNNTAGRIMRKLMLSATAANNNPPSRSTDSGLEVGLLNARIERSNDGRPLHILKIANGSTYLVPSGSYTNAAGGTTLVGANVTRNSGELESSGMMYLTELRNLMRMENIARNQGVGYTSVSVVYNEGLNDAFIGTNAVPDAATYEGYLQDRYDKFEDMLGISNLKMICIKPHEPSGGLGGGDPDYPNDATGTDRLTALGYIRTAFDDFETANSADVSLLDGNSYALNIPTDYIHPSAAGYSDMGKAAEALFAYTVTVVPVA